MLTITTRKLGAESSIYYNTCVAVMMDIPAYSPKQLYRKQCEQYRSAMLARQASTDELLEEYTRSTGISESNPNTMHLANASVREQDVMIAAVPRYCTHHTRRCHAQQFAIIRAIYRHRVQYRHKW